MTRSISAEPRPSNPGLRGRRTAVFLPRQLRMRCRSFWPYLQRRLTFPAGTDSEPHFAALVASSCSTSPNGVARSAGSDSDGPCRRNRSGLPRDVWRELRRESSAKSAPFQSEPTSRLWALASADSRRLETLGEIFLRSAVAHGVARNRLNDGERVAHAMGQLTQAAAAGRGSVAARPVMSRALSMHAADRPSKSVRARRRLSTVGSRRLFGLLPQPRRSNSAILDRSPSARQTKSQVRSAEPSHPSGCLTASHSVKP